MYDLTLLLFLARHGRQKNSYAADSVHVFARVTIEINSVILILSLKNRKTIKLLSDSLATE